MHSATASEQSRHLLPRCTREAQQLNVSAHLACCCCANCSSLCDRWAVAFLLQLLALVIVGGICYTKWKGEFQTSAPADTRDHSSDLGPLAHAFPLIAIAVAVAIAQAAVWLWLMQNHGRTLIWVTLIFGLIVSAAAVILAARAGNLVGAIMAAIFFALNLWSVTHAQAAAVTNACSQQLGQRQMRRMLRGGAVTGDAMLE